MFQDAPCLSLAERLVEFHEQVRISEVAVVFGNLVLQDYVVTPRIPGKFADQTMILVKIVPIMSEDEIRRDAGFELLEEGFHLAAHVRQEFCAAFSRNAIALR